MERWWPPGHFLGYEHSFVHTMADLVRAAVARKARLRPSPRLGNQRVIAAIEQSTRDRTSIS